MSAPKYLRQILSQVQDISKRKQRSLLVFDLDSTLFDVSPRIQKILQNFSEDPTFQTLFPENCQALKKISVHSSDWGFKQALVRAGLDGHHPEFHDALKEFWQKTFFSNEYLEYDLPYAGAIEYVHKLFSQGADIAYLTGRDTFRMGTGTEKILKKWNFPLHEDRAQLYLKPDMKMDDAQFKSDYFLNLKTDFYSRIWLFENEPTNIHLVRNDHNHVEVVFFESTHSGKSAVPVDLPKIINYLLD